MRLPSADPEGPSGWLLHLGGAINERDEAMGRRNRDARFALGRDGHVGGRRAERQCLPGWVHDGWARPTILDRRTYINFQTADGPRIRVRATYGANFDRLARSRKSTIRTTCSVETGTSAHMSQRHHEKRSMADSAFASANEHAISIREKGVSCRELAEFYIERIHKHNPALHAIVVINEADAIRTSGERDEGLGNGIVARSAARRASNRKEAFDLAGLNTTVNFPPLKNNVAATDALIVKRLKALARRSSAKRTSRRCERLSELRASIRPRTIL